MTHKNIIIQSKKELLQIILGIKNQVDLEAFFVDLLTTKEFYELALRWQIVKELSQGTPQRIVAKKLGVGIATVTRGARELSDPKGAFRKQLKKNIIL